MCVCMQEVHPEVQAVASGAIASDYQRLRVESVSTDMPPLQDHHHSGSVAVCQLLGATRVLHGAAMMPLCASTAKLADVP
jgi:hypothetical protein